MANSKMNSEYRARIRKIRPAVRGSYSEIARISGMSLDTVRSVMTMRFRNDAVLEAAEFLIHGEAERIDESIVNVYESQVKSTQSRKTA